MKNLLFFVLAVIFNASAFANMITSQSIELPKHFKVSGTFSGDINETISFHLIFSQHKKTKQYITHIYLFDGTTIEILSPVKNKQDYSVVSFHSNNNELTLLMSYRLKKNDYLDRVSINLDTKTVSKDPSTSHEDFMTSFREKNRSILVYKNKDAFTLKQYNAGSVVQENSLDLSSDKSIDNFLDNEHISAVKSDEFIANGSTSNFKGYLHGHTIYLTKELSKPNATKLLPLNFSNSDGLIKTKPLQTFRNSSATRLKKHTSFIKDDQLFQLTIGKKAGQISINNIGTGEIQNTIDLTRLSSENIKGNSSFNGLPQYLKNASKHKYIPTITVNEASDQMLRVRIDYVDATYTYHNDWWFHHQLFLMHNQMMHQMNFSAPSGFGPRAIDETPFETAKIMKEERFFELVIDTNGALLNNELPNSIHKEVSKKEYIDKLEAVKDLKFESTCFLKDTFRYIAYSKSLKKYIIKSNTIK